MLVKTMVMVPFSIVYLNVSNRMKTERKNETSRIRAEQSVLW